MTNRTRVTIVNSGNGDAGNMLLTDTLPAEVDFAYWVQQSGAVYDSGPPEEITWNGTLASPANRFPSLIKSLYRSLCNSNLEPLF
jgi:hypothetical protein